MTDDDQVLPAGRTVYAEIGVGTPYAAEGAYTEQSWIRDTFTDILSSVDETAQLTQQEPAGLEETEFIAEDPVIYEADNGAFDVHVEYTQSGNGGAERITVLARFDTDVENELVTRTVTELEHHGYHILQR